MSPEGTPAAVFDPASGELPEALDAALEGSDATILLLVASDSEPAAPEMAIALAAARADRGVDTILADADLDAPRLHTLLGAENLEGVVDLFLFGASLQRVTTRPEGRPFLFIPAGGYAPDPGEILTSQRWDRIADELGGGRALLLVFVPAGAPGLAELSGRIGQAVVLADPGGAARVAERLHPTCRVLATVQSQPSEEMAAGTAEGAGVVAAATRGEVPIDHVPTGAAEAGGTDTATRAGRVETEPDLTEPVVIRETPQRQRRSPLVLILLAVALLAAWFGYQHFFAARPAEPTVPLEAVAPERERGDPVETPLPFSVAVEAHQDFRSAMDRVAQLSGADPEITFYLAPVSVNGDLFYRLMAGPATDQESATALMQRLVEREHRTAMDEWAIRPTTYAFLLGEFEEREAARARVDSLGSRGIPAYVLPVRFEGGQRSYRVYGGAYQNEGEAGVMRELLENEGVEAELVTRTGEARE